MKEKNNINYKKIAPHILAWVVIFFIYVFVLSTTSQNPTAEEYWYFIVHNFPIWLLYAVLFYFNIFFLIPKLLFKNYKIVFTAISVILIFVMGLGVTYYKQSNYRGRLKSYIVAESQRTDITVYKKNKNIKRLETRIENTYLTRYFNPVHSMNISTTYSFILVIVSSISISVIGRWKSREKVVEEINRQKIESELAYLKQQINPHFLFNALNSIYSLVLPHSDKASDVVLRLSSILRYMLYETDREKVPVTKELEILADYIELSKLKCADASQIKYNFEGEFSSYWIEPLLMIPFIENAFKYGTNNIDQTVIDINVKCENENFVFTVTNKILVFEKIDSHSGIGVKNISRRLDILYADNHTLEINNSDGIFSVVMALPLKS